MEIKSLRYFLMLARELNFTRAAERLNMSQPPLTKAIGQLEHELGVKLFTRTTRTVNLTYAGEELLREARILVNHADEAARKIRHTIVDRKRRLVIGSVNFALYRFLPKILENFRKIFPEVELELEELPSNTISAKLISAEIDVGFLLKPEQHTLLEVKSIFKEQMRLAVPRFPPYPEQTKISLQEFSDKRFILHSRHEDHTLYQEIIRCCTRAGFKPMFKETKPGLGCIGLVTAGFGVHFVSAQTRCLVLENIICLEVEPSPTLELAVAWRKDDACHYLNFFKDLKF